jgi:tripartite-type tricarboxylate transporter receptor subunit TctC
MVATVWFSISGPAGLPKDIAEKMNTEINRAIEAPGVQERLTRDGLVADPMTLDAFNKFIVSEMATWKPALAHAGLLGKE